MKLKAVQKMASERCPLARAGYSRRIAIYPAHYLISIDEVSKDDRTYARIFGRFCYNSAFVTISAVLLQYSIAIEVLSNAKSFDRNYCAPLPAIHLS
jgi:hypothetical protein